MNEFGDSRRLSVMPNKIPIDEIHAIAYGLSYNKKPIKLGIQPTIPYYYSIEYIIYLFDDETFYEHKILR
jgi:hypothetical protein